MIAWRENVWIFSHGSDGSYKRQTKGRETMKLTKIALSAAMAMSVFVGIPLTTTVFAAENWSYVKKKYKLNMPF